MYFLYVKTHSVTGLKYLGQTKCDPFKYKGSGLYWKAHLKKHGDEHHTVVIQVCETKEELKHWGIHYSQLWKVVDSAEWANLKEEIGDGGGPWYARVGKKHSAESRAKISAAKKGKSINRTAPVSKATKAKISASLKGHVRTRESILKQFETRAENGTLRHTEETKTKMKQHKKSEEHKEKLRTNHARPCKGKVWAHNGFEEGFFEPAHVPQGWIEGRKKMPTPPSQKGKVCITDGLANRLVYPHEIPDGWTKGRTKR